MNAVLFVGHGSRDAEGNDEVRDFVGSLIPLLEEPIVETCFLEFEGPGIAEGIRRCVARGAEHVAVMPIMLFAAGHSKLHIPAAIDTARARYPEIRFSYARPVGVHEGVLGILLERLAEQGIVPEVAAPDTAIVLIGRGSSDPDANGDLYKMSRLLWETLQACMIEPAFSGVTGPLIEEGVERCVRLGAKRIILLPYFLFTGILIKRMEEQVDVFRRSYPEQSFDLAGYFGLHDGLRSILRERAKEALYGEVKANCDMCAYRLHAAEGMEHSHSHDHDHGHHHDHHHDHHDHDHHHDHQDHYHEQRTGCEYSHEHGHGHHGDEHEHHHRADAHEHGHEHMHGSECSHGHEAKQPHGCGQGHEHHKEQQHQHEHEKHHEHAHARHDHAHHGHEHECGCQPAGRSHKTEMPEEAKR